MIRQGDKKFAESPIFIIANIDSEEEINPKNIPTTLHANNLKLKQDHNDFKSWEI